LQEGASAEVECAVSHAVMIVLNAGRAPVTLNMEEWFSETIFNRMVDALLKKR
jgi:hypothetical protein